MKVSLIFNIQLSVTIWFARDGFPKKNNEASEGWNVYSYDKNISLNNKRWSLEFVADYTQ